MDGDVERSPEQSRGLSRRAIGIALWLLPLAALANIGVFLWSMDGAPVASIAERPWLLLGAVGLSIVPWFTNILRLAIWCRFLGVPMPLRSNARVMLGTVVANSITPTATGGTVIKWGFLVGEGVPKDKASTLITTQIAEDSIVLFGLLGISLFVAFGFELPGTIRRTIWANDTIVSTQNALLVMLFVMLGAVLLILFARRDLFGRRVGRWVRRAVGGTKDHLARVARDWAAIIRRGKSVVLASMALAVLQWGARYSVATLVIGFAGGVMLPLLFWALNWLTFTFSTLVPTPGGIGGTEAAFLLLFAPFVAPDVLAPVMAIWRLVMFYLPVAIAAVIFLGLRGRVGARPE